MIVSGSAGSKTRYRAVPILLASCVAAAAAALTGVLFVSISVGMASLLIFVFPQVWLYSLFLAVVFAAPVTFVIIPLAASRLGSHPTVRQLVLPFVGGLGGLVTMWCWTKSGALGYPGPGDVILIAAGAIAGFAAGYAYARVVSEIDR